MTYITSGIDETGRTTRGAAPVAAVSVLHDMVYGGRLVHALDYPVLLHLLFNTAAGRSVTVVDLWQELQAAGIRSTKNADELVGKNAVYDSFKRLIQAGFIRRTEVPNERPGRRPRIAYEVYENPAWNPDWRQPSATGSPLQAIVDQSQAEVKPQVSPLTGTPDVVFRDVGFREVGNGAFPQVSPLTSFRDVVAPPPHTPRRR